MRPLVVAFLLAGPALPVFAAPVTYQIDFTGASVMNMPLPSGSFVYDPDAGFSSFFVDWNGATFDLTSSANAPALATDPATGCDSAAPDYQYQYGFIFMSQTASGCAASAQYAWNGLYYGGLAAQFTFILNVTSGQSVSQDLISKWVYSDVPASPEIDFGTGGWSVTPANSVPEPSTLAMGLAAVLAATGMRLAGRSRRSR